MLGVPGLLVWVSRREQAWAAIGVKGQAAWGPHERWRESEEKTSLASTSVMCAVPAAVSAASGASSHSLRGVTNL